MRMGLGLGIPMNGYSAGAPAFTPTQLANLQCWVHAGNVTLVGGTAVSAMTDMSGLADSGRNLTDGGVVGNRPGYTAADAAFNGKPSMQFAGGAALQSGVWNASFATATTRYLVGRITAYSGYQYFWDRATPGGQGPYCYFPFNSSLTIGDATEIGADAGTANTPLVVSAVYNYGGTSTLYKNAITATLSTGSVGANSNAMNSLTLGAAYSGASGKLTGTICEYLAYTGVHTAAQRAQVMNYLGAKYAITVAA